MRPRNRLVLHFWVAQWMLKQTDPWTRKMIAEEFQVTYPTAREWTRAAVRAGMVTATKKGTTTWYTRT